MHIVHIIHICALLSGWPFVILTTVYCVQASTQSRGRVAPPASATWVTGGWSGGNKSVCLGYVIAYGAAIDVGKVRWRSRTCKRKSQIVSLINRILTAHAHDSRHEFYITCVYILAQWYVLISCHTFLKEMDCYGLSLMQAVISVKMQPLTSNINFDCNHHIAPFCRLHLMHFAVQLVSYPFFLPFCF